jgi:hypothetical protein
MKWLMPFALVGLVLVVYKLLFKPYGVYAGMYTTSFAHFFDREAVLELIRLLSFGLWRLLKDVRSFGGPASVVLGLVAAALALVLLLRFRPPTVEANRAHAASPHTMPVLVGIAILVPVLFIFFYAGRHPKMGTDSAHATLLQPGYAMLLGATAHWVSSLAHSLGRAFFLAPALVLALATGIGVYFSNLNLDLFRVASLRQQEFWSAFQKRFPALPERADFVIDAAPQRYGPTLETFFHFEDIHASYELELGVNRAYQPGQMTGKRIYRVYPIEELMADYRSKGPAMFRNELTRWTHFGNDTLDFGNMTYVYYRGGELFINQEILKVHPTAVYREQADKPLPAWAAAP